MKRHMNAACLALIFMALFLSACNTRPILGDKIVTLYNSELQETKTFAPMDTMYVRVAGLGPEKYYAVFVTDAQGREITRIEVQSDERGLIDQVPLWYDMGLYSEAKDKPPVVRKVGDVDIEAFHVRVKSLSDGQTDFRQPMWIRFKKDPNQTTNPKPVVYAAYCEGGNPENACYLENAFEESGSRQEDGVTASDKTMVFVEAQRVPARVKTRDITHVDFYILPFKGEFLKDGDVLTDYVVHRGSVPVEADRTIKPTLLWDLNQEPKLINPHQDNMAYMVVMDVDQNGRFDLGIDTTRDGLVDDYIDGIDGMGVPGFIVLNTPANDTFIAIKDQNKNVVNAIPSRKADNTHLYFNMDNIALPSANKDVRVYLIASQQQQLEFGSSLTDVRKGEDGNTDFNKVTVKDPGSEDVQDMRLLPYLADVPLLNTNSSNNSMTYKYLDVMNDDQNGKREDVYLDLVVSLDGNDKYNDGDIHLHKAVRIAYVPFTPQHATTSDSEGNEETVLFDETNTVNGATRVYLAVEEVDKPYGVFVVPHRAWNNGNVIPAPLVPRRQGQGRGDGGKEVIPVWDLNKDRKVINPGPENNTYDLVIDKNQNGVFDSGTDAVVTITIRDTEANTLPRVNYANIASGGYINRPNYDYRDLFYVTGNDTHYAGGGYGVKAIFNPYYRSYRGDFTVGESGMYYGQYVDVYIVDKETFDLTQWNNLALNDAIDVRGRKSTVAVQYSCSNGVGIQTIWRAPLKRGAYYVILDVNRNGRIDEGVDIIDAVNQQGRTIVEDASIVGFSVE